MPLYSSSNSFGFCQWSTFISAMHLPFVDASLWFQQHIWILLHFKAISEAKAHLSWLHWLPLGCLTFSVSKSLVGNWCTSQEKRPCQREGHDRSGSFLVRRPITWNSMRQSQFHMQSSETFFHDCCFMQMRNALLRYFNQVRKVIF